MVVNNGHSGRRDTETRSARLLGAFAFRRSPLAECETDQGGMLNSLSEKLEYILY